MPYPNAPQNRTLEVMLDAAIVDGSDDKVPATMLPKNCGYDVG